MALRFLRFIDLPKNLKKGGFDHAAFSRTNGRIYAAHTANDSVDVIDARTDQYLHSISSLSGVAGALVSDELNLLFTSDRAANQVSIFDIKTESLIHKVDVGIRPNGLAFDAKRNILVSGNVGMPDDPSTYSLSVINVSHGQVVATIPTPGRSRWIVYDGKTDAFYINIGNPAKIAVISGDKPTEISGWFEIPFAGPHGLDIDPTSGRLFCACDSGDLFVLNLQSKKQMGHVKLSGPPDVIFFNAEFHELYVAIGDPGCIDVIDTNTIKKIETITTEPGAHTIGFSQELQKVYVFLPMSHRASVFRFCGLFTFFSGDR